MCVCMSREWVNGVNSMFLSSMQIAFLDGKTKLVLLNQFTRDAGIKGGHNHHKVCHVCNLRTH